MIDVLCVTYDSTKQINFLAPGDSIYEVGDKVIVSTENGFHLATVKKGNYRDVMFRNRRRANYMSISIVHGKTNTTYNKSILDDFSILFDYR